MARNGGEFMIDKIGIGKKSKSKVGTFMSGRYEGKVTENKYLFL